MELPMRLQALPIMLIIVACGQLQGQTAIRRIWAVDDGERVRREDVNHWARTSADNRVWNETPGTISLFGGRNETIAFQLIIEAKPTATATAVDVILESLSNGTHVIRNTGGEGDPFNFVGKRIELFTEHYSQITQRSCWCGDVGGYLPPQPDGDYLGWIPDALIPFEARSSVENGVGGAPFSIPAGKNQGVWVDITIPPGTPPGTYSGTLSVTEGGVVQYSIPVSLRVYSFTLPEETHLKNHFFFGWPTITSRHEGNPSPDSEGYWDLYRTYANVFHRHRMDLIDGNRSLEEFRVRLAGYYTGEYYVPEFRYEGPGMRTGNGTYSIGTYDQPEGGPAGFGTTRSSWQAAADSWELWFRENAPSTVRFKYMHDEPDIKDPAVLQDIRDKATWIKTSSGIGRELDILCTVYMAPALFGYVDFWQMAGRSSSPFGYIINTAATRRTMGERIGMYNGTRPAFGSILLDAPLTDNRVNPWIAWKYGVDQYFLWEVAHYAHCNTNVWEGNYRSEGGGERWWGDGNYIYTGEDTKYPGDSRGIHGPIVSMRMKNYRRGTQDYEYLWLARQVGIPTGSLVNTVVPAAFDGYNGATFTSQNQQPVWSERGFRFEEARRTIAELLEFTGKGGFPTEIIGPNVLHNPGFEGGETGWGFYSNSTAAFSVEGPGCTGAGAARVTVEDPASNMQLYQCNISLEPQVRYRLTFTGYSPTGSDVALFVAQHDSPYVNYGLAASMFDLTGIWNTHSVDFTTENFSHPVSDARLFFWFAPYAQKGDEYWIDDVQLARLYTTGMTPEQGPVTFPVLENYPNPFNPSTTIRYQVKSRGHISIIVYDILGREVSHIVEGVQDAGIHEIRFDGSNLASGVYLYRLQTAEVTQTKKMVLAR